MVEYVKAGVDQAQQLGTSMYDALPDAAKDTTTRTYAQAQQLGASLFEALPDSAKDTTARTYTQAADTAHGAYQRAKERVDYWAKWLGGELHAALGRLSGTGSGTAAGAASRSQALPTEARRLMFKDGIEYVARARQADRKLRKWPDGLISLAAMALIWYLALLDLVWWRVRQAFGGALTTGSRLLFG